MGLRMFSMWACCCSSDSTTPGAAILDEDDHAIESEDGDQLESE